MMMLLYINDSRGFNLSNNDTDDLSEGSTNLYFTMLEQDQQSQLVVIYPTVIC